MDINVKSARGAVVGKTDKTQAQFIYEISPLIYVFFPIPIMGKSTIENPHIFYSHFLNRC